MSDFTLVYRFQNDQGRGPWQGNATAAYDYAQRVGKYHSCSDMHGPYTEGKHTELHKHYSAYGVTDMLFAFTSLRQLKLSFPSAAGRAALGKVGQRLVVMKVPKTDLLRGDRQCIFPRNNYEVVGYRDLKTLKPVQS